MSKNIPSFLLSLIALCLWLYGYITVAQSVDLSEEMQRKATDLWMIADGISKPLFIFAFLIQTRSYFREWITFIFILSINNLLDELYFNPYELGVNEWAISILAAVYFTLRIRMIYYATKQ